MADTPQPLGTLRLFGLADRRLDMGLTVSLVVVVIASRLVAFPASIWEQDEAYFAAAVLHFDPIHHMPHPPWFPLWIGLGKLVHHLGTEADDALRLVSAAFSVWMVFPLTALWSALIPRGLAVCAAVLFSITPGAWFFSGRAFSGTAATALLVAGLAFWLLSEDRSRWCVSGATLAALAVLVRPQLFPAAAGALVLIVLRTSPHVRWRTVLAFATPLILGVGGLAVSAGGFSDLYSSLVVHAEYHLSHLGEASHSLGGSGLSRSLGHPALTVAWLVLFHVGMIRLFRRGRQRDLAPLLIGALLPVVLVTHGLSNPAHARYWVPVLALTCGFVVFGMEAILRRWTRPAVCSIAVIAAVILVPQAIRYRKSPSPPVAALGRAVAEAEAREADLVIDSTLHAFWLYREARAPLTPMALLLPAERMSHDGATAASVLLVDVTDLTPAADWKSIERFAVTIPIVRSLSQERFLDVMVGLRSPSNEHLAPD